MGRVAILVIQLAITFALVAILVPAILVNVPAARSAGVGPVVVVVLAAVVFLGLRLVWPKRRT